MIVKHITQNSFDIFYNSGWLFWARFVLDNNKLTQCAGKPVPKNIFIFLSNRYTSK